MLSDHQTLQQNLTSLNSQIQKLTTESTQMSQEMHLQTSLRDQGYDFLQDLSKEKRKFKKVVRVLESIAYGKS